MVVSTLKNNISEVHKRDIGLFITQSYNDSTNLNSLLSFKKMSKNGTIQESNLEECLKLYANILEANKSDYYPIFEYKKQNEAILLVKGDGLWDIIWGKVLVNLDTKEISKIEFDHISETPGMGSEIRDSIYENQFIGAKVELNSLIFGLKQDSKKIIDGKIEIDGISGATIKTKPKDFAMCVAESKRLFIAKPLPTI